jgi:hypothetical protein
MKRRTFAACAAGSAAAFLIEHARATPRTSASHRTSSQLRDATILYWNAVLGDAIAATRTPPTVAARAISMVYEAAYNAWAYYDEKARFTLPSMGRPSHARYDHVAKSVAISHAIHAVLVDLFPSQFPAVDAALAAIVADAAARDRDWLSAVQDGSNQLGDLAPGAYADYTGYVPVNTPDSLVDPLHWQPLRVPDGNGGSVVQRFLTAQWGLVRPFALGSGSQLRPVMDRAAPSDAELAELVALSAGLTDEHKALAEYWAGGPGTVTPPGLWTVIAQEVSRRDRNNLDDDVKMFFALGQALIDASIAAWDAKRAYDSCRPYTTVRIAYRDQIIEAWGGPGLGPQSIAGDAWLPYQPATFVTPPFPEFVSGHSTFSAASAEVLGALRGDRIALRVPVAAGSSKIEPGLPAQALTLSWSSLSEAAASAGMSRRYGGIHFEQGDLKGREMGQRIGQLVLEKCDGLFGVRGGRRG